MDVIESLLMHVLLRRIPRRREPRDIDCPGLPIGEADETITLQFETSERVDVFNDDQWSMITVSSQSGDTTGRLWEAVTSVSGLSNDSEVSFVIEGFEIRQGNPMSTTNTSFVDRTSDSSRIWMDVTDPHVMQRFLLQTVSAATSIAQAISWHWPMRRSRFSLKRASG